MTLRDHAFDAAITTALTALLVAAFACYLVLGSVMIYLMVSKAAWYPAAFAGYAFSRYRRQCDAQAELERSLPIARVV